MFPLEKRDTTTRVIDLAHQFGPDLDRLPLLPIRLRWGLDSKDAETAQHGYQIRSRPRSELPWTEHESVESAETLGVPLPEGTLTPRESLEMQVRIFTNVGWTPWSETLLLQAAADPKQLAAKFIGIESEVAGPAPRISGSFELTAIPNEALLTATALGIYSVRINDEPLDYGVLNPGWTSYNKRLVTDSYDVSHLLRLGQNTISFDVADGWFRGRFGFASRQAIYGDTLAVLAQIDGRFDDEWRTITATDLSWTASFGSIVSTSLYDGSAVDYRREDEYATTLPTTLVDFPLDRLSPRSTAPVKKIAQIPMKLRPLGTDTVAESPQNISGWVRLCVRGKAGDTVVIRHAEMLHPDGSIDCHSLRSAKATDSYVLAHDGVSVLEPPFTFHGFQFAQISTDAEVLTAEAIAISSALQRRSSFQSSHPLLDAFHNNVLWSQRDNFVSIPTDCPQRDERLGWTGDAQAFGPASSILFDCESFWASWLEDVALDQGADGAVASVVPNILLPGDLVMGGKPAEHMGRAGWADVATILPWTLYQYYGDTWILERQLHSMRRWVDYLEAKAGPEGLIPREDFQYSDWLDPDAPGDRPWDAKVEQDLVSNLFYLESLGLLSKTYRVLGASTEADDYDSKARSLAAAIWQRWSEHIPSTQTGAALSLVFQAVPVPEIPKVAAALAKLVRDNKGRISTGFLGTPHILEALSSHGYWQEAYLMLLCQDIPSWLYQVTKGATTVWERWDAIAPDGTVHAGDMDTRHGDSMISFNHYAYGAVLDWVYRHVLGIAPNEPGYQSVMVAPTPADKLTSARGSISTSRGKVSLSWHLSEDGMKIELELPTGVEASVALPLTENSTTVHNGAPVDEFPRVLTGGFHQITVTEPLIVNTDLV